MRFMSSAAAVLAAVLAAASFARGAETATPAAEKATAPQESPVALDAAVLLAAEHAPKLAAQKGPEFGTAALILRRTAEDSWAGYQDPSFRRPVQGPQWPAARAVSWSEPVAVAASFGPGDERDVMSLAGLEPSQAGDAKSTVAGRRKAWDRLWEGRPVPAELAALTDVLVDEPVPLEDLSEKDLKSLEQRFAAAFPALGALPRPYAVPPGAPVPRLFAEDGPDGAVRRLTVAWNALCRVAAEVDPKDGSGEPPPPARRRAEAATAALKEIETAYAEIVLPLGLSDEHPLSLGAFGRDLQRVSAPFDDLLALATLYDDFQSRAGSANAKASVGLQHLRRDAAILISPTSSADDRKSALIRSGVDWEFLKKGCWEIAVLRRYASELDARVEAIETALRRVTARFATDMARQISQAVGARLGFEVAAWDRRHRFCSVDLRTAPSPTYSVPSDGPAPSDPNGGALPPEKAMARWLNGFYDAGTGSHASTFISSSSLGWDAETGRIRPLVLTAERLAELGKTALADTPPIPGKPIKIEIFANSLELRGAIEVSAIVRKEVRSARRVLVVIYAGEVACDGGPLVVDGPAELAIVCHRFRPALPAARPFLAVGKESRLLLYVSQPAACPPVADAAVTGKLADSFVAAGYGGLPPNPWAPLYGESSTDAARRRLDEFWITVAYDLVALVKATPGEADKRGILAEAAALPRTVVNPGGRDRRVGEIETEVGRLSRELLGEKVVELRDTELGRDYPCLSVYRAGRHHLFLLPDEVVVADTHRTDGKLGDVEFRPEGWRFLARLVPRVSAVAATRASTLAAQWFPAATFVGGPPLNEYRIDWRAEGPVHPLLADGGPTGTALGRGAGPTPVATKVLSGSGIAEFMTMLRAAPLWRSDAPRCGLSVFHAGGDEELAAYRCPVRFSATERPLVHIAVKPDAKGGAVCVLERATAARLPLTVGPVVTADGVVVTASAAAAQIAPGATAALAAPRDATRSRGIAADARLDLSEAQPFDLFAAAGAGDMPRKAAVALGAVHAARFTSQDGEAGAGAYVDLARSRVVLNYLASGDGRSFPAQVRSFEELARRNLEGSFEYYLPAGFRSELVLELYPSGAPASARPTAIRFDIPASSGGQAGSLDVAVDLRRLNEALAGGDLSVLAPVVRPTRRSAVEAGKPHSAS